MAKQSFKYFTPRDKPKKRGARQHKKSLNKLGIFKNQEVKVNVKRTNNISFMDKELKYVRYISLTPKQMKYFKEVEQMKEKLKGVPSTFDRDKMEDRIIELENK